MTTNNNWIIDRTAISPYPQYCDGYMAPGAIGEGYVSVLKVESGLTPMTDDALLDGIMAYDDAESKGSYIGQINMITASSFSGLAGQIWGYDLAIHDDIATGKVKPEFSLPNYDGTPMQCYDAKPLLDAGIELFGTQDKRRYPLVPGAHTICANKNISAYGMGSGTKTQEAYAVWSFISISIARDRSRGANIFIEDAGLWTDNNNEADVIKFLENKKREMAACTLACGKNAQVPYEKSFIGYSYTMVAPGQMGMAITVGPYVSLAQKAVTSVGGFDYLNKITLSTWVSKQA